MRVEGGQKCSETGNDRVIFAFWGHGLGWGPVVADVGEGRPLRVGDVLAGGWEREKGETWGWIWLVLS